ncbi:GntR family transcriptional regulator [Streptomyces sp. NPDC056716]|uniref:GntR family transcriptional regulator n=1 Tax=unclassified Streptomyces TaxID=2593676 RepID=UPI0036B6E54F
MTDTLTLTIAQRVAEQLRSEIRQGILAAGEPLRQNDVAARLGVSSTPVREAFHLLERMGLVEREGRRGVRVFSPSMRDLVEGYEVRGGLEAQAARLAAVRLSDQALASLGEIMGRMHRPGVEQQEFIRLNAEFHALIAQASGNARLAKLVAAEQAATSSFVAFLGVDASSAEEAHAEHAAVLAALEARDADAAAAAMSAHLYARVEALESRLEDSGTAR